MPLNKMRILINDHAGYPFPIQLSRNLAEKGHDVLHSYCSSVLTPNSELFNSIADTVSMEIAAIQLSVEFNRYGLLTRWQQEKELGRKLSDIALSFSPDIILSANTPLKSQSYLLNSCKALNAKFIYWVQDLLGIGIRINLRKKMPVFGNLVGRYFQFLEHQLLKMSDHVVLISDDFRSKIPAELITNNKVSIIENWAPLDDLQIMPKVNAWSKKYQIDKKFCYMYSGTLGMKHNPELLLELALKLRNKKDCCIVVISEGIGANYLSEKKIEFDLDNLILFGFQPYGQLSQIFGSADVLLAILEHDASSFAVPSKVLTYLCTQRPLLLAIPSKNLAARIVAENQAGIVVSPSDDGAFIDSAMQLMQDRDLRNGYALNGLRYARNTFNIAKITDDFESIMLSLS